MFGVYEYSWYYFQQQLIEAGVRDAARYLARVPLTLADLSTPCAGGQAGCYTPCNQPDPQNGNSSYYTYAQNIALYATTSVATQRVKGWSGPVTFSCPGTDNSSGTYDDAKTIYTVQATATFADPSLGFFGLLGLPMPSITVTHNERFIGAS
jgi:Flp pilus assembly protein TadG